MENLRRINENEYLVADAVTGGTWRVVSPRLTPEGAEQAVARQIAETGARPAKGETATIHFQIRIAEDRAEPGKPY